MTNLEIERKFFISEKNSSLRALLKEKIPMIEERYYLYRKEGIELRFTKLTKGTESYYNFDRMALQRSSDGGSHLVRSKERLRISAEEFDQLLALVTLRTPSVQPIVRWSYHMSDNPKFEIKVYKLAHEGLIRAEIEFDSHEEAAAFVVPDWFGPEITDSPVGIDTRLPDLSEDEFQSVLAELNI